MNLSMQIIRGFGALAMCAAFSAFALSQPVAVQDGQDVAVAHSRLEIVSASGADNAPRYQVASIHVGAPVALTPDQVRRTAMRTRAGDNNHS